LKTTGTLVNYYFHCKRQCYLAGNRINLEDNSELVKIGKAMHETKISGPKTEVSIDNIKIDKIKGDYLIEYKKSNSDVNACKWQIYYYLYILKQKGITKKGKLICFEKNKSSSKTLELDLSESIELELVQLEENIESLLKLPSPPEVINKPRCKKCAYYYYCYI
jgi:CRISPR-associated exonuclease, Cas4 family